MSQPRECWTASPALLCAFHGFPLPPSLQCLPQPYLGFLSTPVPPKLPSAVDPFWRVLFLSLPPLSRIFVYDLLHAFSVLFLHFSEHLRKLLGTATATSLRPLLFFICSSDTAEWNLDPFPVCPDTTRSRPECAASISPSYRVLVGFPEGKMPCTIAYLTEMSCPHPFEG